MGSRPMKREKHLHRMINLLILFVHPTPSEEHWRSQRFSSPDPLVCFGHVITSSFQVKPSNIGTRMQLGRNCCITSDTTVLNKPITSSKNSHFQNEAKCKTFFVKMSFVCMRIKNIFMSMALQ